ncbi:MAG: hypothetical protein MAG581_01140 [Deltaproteobacteria bacterium]|nr:hypothetical protein [Deltaproteobacteria bacterium]
MSLVSQNKLLFFIVSGILFVGSGCSNIIGFTKEQTTPTNCADLVIERAFNLHEEAKSGLALFFDERSDNQLYQAFYAASDSVYESRKVKKCWDRRISHYYAMQNLQEMNTSLARIIRRNMPDDDRGEMISVYRDQYKWVMPSLR